MTTISEFIESTALEETIVTNCPKYREKFLKIVEKAGIGESDTKDKQALNKIRSTRSWNWAAFFFNTHWAIYRKEKLLGWALFIISWLIVVISTIYPVLDGIGNIFPVFVAFFVGMFGNSYILRNSIQINEQTTSPEDRRQRSPTGLAIAIVVDIALIGISIFLLFDAVI